MGDYNRRMEAHGERYRRTSNYYRLSRGEFDRFMNDIRGYSAAKFKKFFEYHKNNPRIMELFVERTREIHGERNHYSAYEVLLQICLNENVQVQGRGRYRISSAVMPGYIRLLIAKHPVFIGLYDLKPLKSQDPITRPVVLSKFVVEGHQGSGLDEEPEDGAEMEEPIRPNLRRR